MKEAIVLIGAGNVGYHLGIQLAKKDFDLQQIFSRSSEKAKLLGDLIQVDFVTDWNEITTKGSLYILAVPDDSISIVAKTLSKIIPKDALVVHTSGATSSSVLSEYFLHFGVFYPLQSFSIDKKIDFEKLPLCIFSNKKPNLERLRAVGERLSDKVYEISDDQRAVLHVAAVFVNNFTNHLFQIAWEILQKEKLPFDLLRPLILETVEKIQAHEPKKMQTGPAIRYDLKTIQRHLSYLANHPDYQEIYSLLSRNINPKLISKL